MQLNSSVSGHAGVHNVQGELMLRNGPYMGESDTLMRLSGVYVPASGKLHALLEPPHPVVLPFAPHEANLASPHYRQALREAAQQVAAGQRHYQSAADDLQRALGLDTRPLSEQLAPDWEDGAPLARQLGLGRQCAFTLDLSVSWPPGGNGSDSTDAAAAPLAAGKRGRKSVRGSERTTASARRGRRKQQRGLPAAVVGDTDALVGPEDGAWGAPEADDLTLNGTLAAANCGISVRLSASTTHVERYYAKAVNYTLMITGISFIQVLLLVRQIEATATTATASRVSLLCIGQQAIMDAYLCLLHLTTGIMVEPLFNAFATASFFEFVIFAIFEMRWLLMAWRTRRGAQDGWQQQRELTLMYARFYGALLLGILLTYQLQKYMKWVLFGLYSWWLPQIVLSAVSDTRQPLKPVYVAGTSAARLALPLYLYGCPANLLRIPPAPGMLAALVAFVAAQAGVLMWQYWSGSSRCFVPRKFLPPKYDYHRPAPAAILPGGSQCDAPIIKGGTAHGGSSSGDGGDNSGSGGGGGGAFPPQQALVSHSGSGAGSMAVRHVSCSSCLAASGAGISQLASHCDEETGSGSIECVICMNPVEVARQPARMLTPCNHFFHVKCLQRWMDVRMECPICRRLLPPP